MSAPRIKVTQSELSTFRTCRKKWDFRYRQALIPLRTPKPLTVGAHFHHALRALYRAIQLGARSLDDMLKVTRSELAQLAHEHQASLLDAYVDAGPDERSRILLEMESAGREAAVAVEMYVRTFGVSDAEEYEVLAVERTFEVPLGDGRSHGMLAGQIDLALRHRRSGIVWLGEHKTTSGSAADLDARLDLDGQVRAYLYAMRSLFPGEELGGVILNATRKRAPAVPKVNKDGRVSVAACDTTRDIYLAALEAQERGGVAITAAQRDFAETLPWSTARWITRHEVYIPPAHVDEWVAEARADLRLLRASSDGAKRALPITRNPASCTLPWTRPCAYREICVDDSPERRAAEYRVGRRYEELAGDGEQEQAAETKEW